MLLCALKKNKYTPQQTHSKLKVDRITLQISHLKIITLKYRAEIDGLRALAIFAVIGFHFFPGRISGGFVGVDVFFVISGYLITGTLIDNTRAENFFILGFYERRIKRLFPALLLVFFATLVIGWYGLLSDELKFLGKHITAGSLFVSNFVYWQEAGYFDADAISKPLLHLWSLSVEEQYYLVWPLAVYIIVKYIDKGHYYLLGTILLSLVYSVYAVNNDQTVGYYSPFSRFWEFGVGSLLVFWERSKPQENSHLTRLINEFTVILAVSMILLSVVLLTDEASFPGVTAIPSVLGTVLLLGVGAKSDFNRFVFGNKIAIWFGKISYPLYLWHWPILSIGYLYYSEFPSRTYRVAGVFLAIIIAWLTYELIEKRVRFNRKRGVAYLLLLANFAIGYAGYVTFKNEGFPEREVLQSTYFSSEARRQFFWQYSNNPQCLTDYQFPRVSELKWWFCMKSDTQPTTVAIIGDSFANQLYPGFTSNPRLENHTFLSIGTCDFALKPSTNDPRNPCYKELAMDQERFIDRILRESKAIKYIIIDGIQRKQTQEYIERFIEKVKVLESQGKIVITFKPHLKADFHPKACFSRPLRKIARDCSFSVTVRDELDEAVSPLFEELEAQNVGLIFDPNDVFCTKQKCSWVRDNMPLHRDITGHMSEFASRVLQEYFTPWAETNIPQIFLKQEK